MIDTIKDLNNNLKKNIQGYIAMSICDIETGECLFSESLDENFDIDLASACNLEVVNAKLKAIDALDLTESIDNIVIHLETQIHIIDITPSRKYFIYLSVDSTKATIGLVKSMLKKYKKEIEI